ncbi:MAG: tRNA pseudouridine(38-40) synthase TruA [Chloroflexota bacterium]
MEKRREAGETSESPGEGFSKNVMLIVEYDGTGYSGFQVQPNAPSVQGQLEQALLRLTGESIRVVGAGRTDAGVHATGQVVNFVTTSALPPEKFVRALNSLLPPDVAVKAASYVEAGFHARFSARSREYEYRILNRSAKPAVGRQYVYHYRRWLDVEAMHEACQSLVGRHDFASFAAADEKVRSTVRTVLAAECKRDGEMITVAIRADAFLPRMVRNIVGTLLWVGTHAIDVAQFREIMLARDRNRAGPTAPARGLFLTKVDY